MRSKTVGINVRVTPEEKEKLCESARDCGLSLSEKIYKTFRLVRRLKKNLESLEKSEILCRLTTIEDLLK